MNSLPIDHLTHVERIIVVHEGLNPTTDFYLTQRLQHASIPVLWFSHSDHPDPAILDGALVIVVRYLTPTWQRYLNKHFESLNQCVWLIDDDLLDISTLLKVSGGLGWKWFWRAWLFKSWFAKRSVSLWVSTPYLAHKYADWQPSIIPPCSPYAASLTPCLCRPFSPELLSSPSHPIVFYHGSVSHRREQKWLYPIFEAVAHRCPEVRFEVIGNQSVVRLFAAIPQVQVIPPMSWSNYKQWIQQPGRAVGLAPLLDDAVNAARAPTRFYDIQASGAIGIYSAGHVYESVVEEGVNGYFLPTERALWVDKIIHLVQFSTRGNLE